MRTLLLRDLIFFSIVIFFIIKLWCLSFCTCWFISLHTLFLYIKSGFLIDLDHYILNLMVELILMMWINVKAPMVSPISKYKIRCYFYPMPYLVHSIVHEKSGDKYIVCLC